MISNLITANKQKNSEKIILEKKRKCSWNWISYSYSINYGTREILPHFIYRPYTKRESKILFWTCQFSASITDLFAAWLCSKWDRFTAHYRSVVFGEMRLGLGQPHLVDQPGFASQTSLERTNKLFISHGQVLGIVKV